MKEKTGLKRGEAYNDRTFREEDFSGAQLDTIECSECLFDGCTFVETNLYGAQFDGCLFENCKLSQVVLTECSFRDVRFRDCKISGVGFTGINQFLVEWAFERSVLEFCDFGSGKFPGTAFLDSIVRECEFVETDLSGALFTRSDLDRSRFHRADLSDADFREARNYVIDPRENQLSGAKFSQPEVFALLDVFGVVVE